MNNPRAQDIAPLHVQDAAQADLSRSKSYDLVRRGEFPCRVLPIGRTTRVVSVGFLGGARVV
ncbi:hypothetical protein RB628_31115, partial [Streptomyces sp. ADMS]|nr:hypothetical protein [Streptomyces sp. ADMS]